MVGLAGMAEIVYENGCRQKVEPGSRITVADSLSCKTTTQDSGWVTQTTEERRWWRRRTADEPVKRRQGGTCETMQSETGYCGFF